MNKISNGINNETDGLSVCLFQKQTFAGNLKNDFSENFAKVLRKTWVKTCLEKNPKNSAIDNFLRFFSKFFE